MKKTKIYKNKKRNFKKKTKKTRKHNLAKKTRKHNLAKKTRKHNLAKKTRKHKIKKMKGGVVDERITNNDYKDMNDYDNIIYSLFDLISLTFSSEKYNELPELYNIILAFITSTNFHKTILMFCHIIKNKETDKYDKIYNILEHFKSTLGKGENGVAYRIIYKLLLLIIIAFIYKNKSVPVDNILLEVLRNNYFKNLKIYSSSLNFAILYLKRLTKYPPPTDKVIESRGIDYNIHDFCGMEIDNTIFNSINWDGYNIKIINKYTVERILLAMINYYYDTNILRIDNNKTYYDLKSNYKNYLAIPEIFNINITNPLPNEEELKGYESVSENVLYGPQPGSSMDLDHIIGSSSSTNLSNLIPVSSFVNSPVVYGQQATINTNTDPMSNRTTAQLNLTRAPRPVREDEVSQSNISTTLLSRFGEVEIAPETKGSDQLPTDMDMS
jgi:hypothetical protein